MPEQVPEIGVPVEKPWGTSTLLHVSVDLILMRLEVNPGGYCSIHLHEKLISHFTVIWGIAEVAIFESLVPAQREEGGWELTGSREGTSYRRLGYHQSLIIPPLKLHRFKALDTGFHAMEAYFPVPGTKGVDRSDIRRFTEGGVDR